MTVGERLFDLVNGLYIFCRHDHRRTDNLIQWLLDIINTDQELIDFLNKCSNQLSDPRGNHIFGQI